MRKKTPKTTKDAAHIQTRDTSATRIKRQWILSVSPSLWYAVTKKCAYATSSNPEIQRIARGDHLIFYVRGTGKFNCIYKVDSDWHEPCGKWPVRVTDELNLSIVRTGVVGVRSVASLLGFAKKSKWIGLYLHGGLGNHGKPITSKDYSAI